VTPTWSGLVEPLERISDRLGRPWGVVSHLKAVRDSEALRTAVETVQPEKVALTLKLAQSAPVYAAFKALREGPTWSSLTEAQRRVVEGELRDATLSGVGLEGAAKTRFNEIQQELSKIGTSFSNNLLDATKAFTRVVTDPAHVAGLPPSARALAAQTAVAKGHAGATPEAGPWVFTLDIPSYQAVLSHASHRPLREELYRAYITRASGPGEGDNTPLIERTLALKRERAQLLGFPHHAAVSLSSKMATLERAEALLEELRAASFSAAVTDLEDVRAFAAAAGAPEASDMRQWDVGFWAERLREEKYGLKEEELRPYFPLPAILDGLFALVTRLFGVHIEAADGAAPVWHPDVRFFTIKDAAGAPIAHFYLDPYSRPAEKRGGAWMDEVAGRSTLLAAPGSSVRLPVAHMVCNGNPPLTLPDGSVQPALMTFREVETLLHECGHALQHMLTRCDEGLVAGIRGVEWDAVELPSQFMENWAVRRFCAASMHVCAGAFVRFPPLTHTSRAANAQYHKPTLMGLSRHVDTGAPLPDEMFDKLVAAKNYRAGSAMLRQLHFASVDLELHSRYVPGGEAGGIFAVDRRVAARTAVMPPLPEDRFLAGFSHIFAGGYAAGYYSYKWAEVLSADAFAAFEEAGLDDAAAVQATGARFRDTVLALGGGRAPLDVFVDFRGRAPSTAALLRHSGLTTAAR
jgi:oligopeptidase A